MSFGEAIRTCVSKYVTFSGRASRSEYWWFVLFVVIGALVASLLDTLIFEQGAIGIDTSPRAPIAGTWQLATFLPLLAAGWRRLHDVGRPGWWMLLPVAVSFAIALVFGTIVGFEVALGTGETVAGATGLIGLLAATLAQVVATVVLIVWLAKPSDAGANAFGAAPAEVRA